MQLYCAACVQYCIHLTNVNGAASKPRMALVMRCNACCYVAVKVLLAQIIRYNKLFIAKLCADSSKAFVYWAKPTPNSKAFVQSYDLLHRR